MPIVEYTCRCIDVARLCKISELIFRVSFASGRFLFFVKDNKREGKATPSATRGKLVPRAALMPTNTFFGFPLAFVLVVWPILGRSSPGTGDFRRACILFWLQHAGLMFRKACALGDHVIKHEDDLGTFPGPLAAPAAGCHD